MKKCVLIILDGLGDRSYPAFNYQTPLQAAHTPALDRIAAAGANGLFHAAQLGQALPSENAHFAIFGYDQTNFPGRGALEALGAGVALSDRDVALLAHFASVERIDGRLFLNRDTPTATSDEIQELIPAISHYQWQDINLNFHPIKGLFGVIVMKGDVSPFVTDTNPMRDFVPIMELLPWKSHADDPAAIRTAQALKTYLIQTHTILNNHPINQARTGSNLPPLNGLVTQRAGQLKKITLFTEQFGMKGLSITSGVVFKGLSTYLGLDFLQTPDTDNPEKDLAERLLLARAALADHDFIHVHTKAPDEAAHKKNPLFKKQVIEALDCAIGKEIDWFLNQPDILIVVTSDHSTPSSGPLVHSGEAVPLVMCGEGLRRDAVTQFDEVSAATGALGTVRNRELMWLILNHLDRIKLMGIMDADIDQSFWPGNYRQFTLE
ncbi:MAG: 2,3-bisphosphoglycerate-independent phosphoglycerate mutase [Syntrophaceae bacterium]|nr:2,3-bisphosphoglycerate-independent phosphoglycerate mutase [Syntrophaceae bacterium]